MGTNTIFNNSNHPKSVIARLKAADGLPFKHVLSSSEINKNIQDHAFRDRFYSPDITMWGFLSQVLSADQSCQAAVAHVIAHFASQGDEVPSANTAAYSKARSRLPEGVISNLVKESAQQLERDAPARWLWRDKHIKLIDGSSVWMPDTHENQTIYPQMKTQKPGLGFPIARIVGVISYSTGAILDLAMSRYYGKGAGEHSLLRQLITNFKSGDIVLGDRYYCSYFLIAALIKQQVDVVFPLHNARYHDFRKGKVLDKKDHLIEWKKPQRPTWMSVEEYNSFSNTISIREAEISIERKGFRSKPRIIITTFLDSKSISKQDLKEISSYRWQIELDFRSIKDTMRMGTLRGKTPAMVRKEIWMHLLAYNLVRKIMAQAAHVHDKKPRELSFKLTLQLIEAFRHVGIFVERSVCYESLLKSITHKKVGNRSSRCEPRRLKRRPKNYPLLMKSRSHYHGEHVNAIS